MPSLTLPPDSKDKYDELSERHNDIEYWRECLARCCPRDTFSKMLIIGKIKQLTKEQSK